MSGDRDASPLNELDSAAPADAASEPKQSDEPWELHEYRAAIGLNADYYLRCWGLLGDGQPARVIFNFGALLSGLWLPFRKMYRATLIFYALIGSWVFFELFVIVRTWNMELPDWLFSLTRMIPPAICGLFGNRWYYHHIQRLVATARAEQPHDREARLALLQQRGGASVQSACSMVLLFSIMVIIALMVIELLAPT
jgi:hypothetical protein